MGFSRSTPLGRRGFSVSLRCALYHLRSFRQVSCRPRQLAQGALFYEFSLERHVPEDHLLRSIDRAGIRTLDLTDNELAKLHIRHLVGGPANAPPTHHARCEQRREEREQTLHHTRTR